MTSSITISKFSNGSEAISRSSKTFSKLSDAIAAPPLIFEDLNCGPWIENLASISVFGLVVILISCNTLGNSLCTGISLVKVASFVSTSLTCLGGELS